MNPMIRRQQAAQATVDRFLGKPLSYGKDDCARMAVFCLKQLGVKVSLLKAGTYSSPRGAARVLKSLGHDSLSSAVDAIGRHGRRHQRKAARRNRAHVDNRRGFLHMMPQPFQQPGRRHGRRDHFRIDRRA